MHCAGCFVRREKKRLPIYLYNYGTSGSISLHKNLIDILSEEGPVFFVWYLCLPLEFWKTCFYNFQYLTRKRDIGENKHFAITFKTIIEISTISMYYEIIARTNCVVTNFIWVFQFYEIVKYRIFLKKKKNYRTIINCY